MPLYPRCRTPIRQQERPLRQARETRVPLPTLNPLPSPQIDWLQNSYLLDPDDVSSSSISAQRHLENISEDHSRLCRLAAARQQTVAHGRTCCSFTLHRTTEILLTSYA